MQINLILYLICVLAGTAGRMSSWHDIDDNLAADLDGSLSGLGEDLSTASYNMRLISKIYNISIYLFIY
jgi:hypothetical protein